MEKEKTHLIEAIDHLISMTKEQKILQKTKLNFNKLKMDRSLKLYTKVHSKIEKIV